METTSADVIATKGSLVAMIKTNVAEEMTKIDSRLAERFAKMHVDLAQIQGNLDTLIHDVPAAGKRTVRGESSKEGAKDCGAAAAAAKPKKLNKMLYFKDQYNNNPAFHEKYFNAYKNLISNEKIKGTSESQKIWQLLSEPEKEKVKQEFLISKAAEEKTGAPQLDADPLNEGGEFDDYD